MHQTHFHLLGVHIILCEQRMCRLALARQQIAGSAMNERRDVTIDDDETTARWQKIQQDPETYRPECVGQRFPGCCNNS